MSCEQMSIHSTLLTERSESLHDLDRWLDLAFALSIDCQRNDVEVWDSVLSSIMMPSAGSAFALQQLLRSPCRQLKC